MLKVTFSEPTVLWNENTPSETFIAKFVLVKSVLFVHIKSDVDFYLDCDNLMVNFGYEYIQSIEHVKPTEL